MTTKTIGENGNQTPQWLQTLREEGAKPGFLFFTKKEILSKKIIPKEEIGQGYAWKGREYFCASEVCNRETEIIATWSPQQRLPVILDERIILKHLHITALQLFRLQLPPVQIMAWNGIKEQWEQATVPHPSALRAPRGYAPNTRRVEARVTHQEGEVTKVYGLDRHDLMEYVCRRTPLWIVGPHNASRMDRYPVHTEAKLIAYSLIHLLYPEMGIGVEWMFGNQSQRRQPTTALNMNELTPFMQQQISALQNHPQSRQPSS